MLFLSLTLFLCKVRLHSSKSKISLARYLNKAKPRKTTFLDFQVDSAGQKGLLGLPDSRGGRRKITTKCHECGTSDILPDQELFTQSLKRHTSNHHTLWQAKAWRSAKRLIARIILLYTIIQISRHGNLDSRTPGLEDALKEY